jgi:hypothetical protein
MATEVVERVASQAIRLDRRPKGGKPLNIGMNQAKRVARSADRLEQLLVQRAFGPGHPRQHRNHQQLVRARHSYYHGQHEEFLRGQKNRAP